MYSTALKTFSNQGKLPRLPIPELDLTAARYKRSLLPLLSAAEHAEVTKKIDKFFKPNGLAEVLQNRLYDLDKQEAVLGLNWLDRLWLRKAYLEYRIPTFINVNWWNQFRDPPNGLVETTKEGKASDFQIKRSADIIKGVVDYSNRINNEEIPPDMTRSGPLCMHQLKGMFGTTRIADPYIDTVSSQWPCLAKHITVIYKDQIFSVQVINSIGQSLPLNVLESQLQSVINQVDKTPLEQRQPPVGLLTTEHRDTWGSIRQQLQKVRTNAKALEEIDRSIFTLCLDDYSSPIELDSSHRNIFHGRKGRNRWFDKCLQFIVENNGRAGVNGEHSPIDAVVPLRVVEDVLEREPFKDIKINSFVNVEEPRLLTWDITNNLNGSIRNAEKNATALIENLDSVLLHYGNYGSDFMKKAKISPDSWMQMIYQLAYYRHTGTHCPTYESASTRKFIAGRTETVRSCTLESVAFVQAWDNKDVKMKDKLRLLKEAIASHSEYMKAASNGHGVDRHLLGLRSQMTEDEAASNAATIFKDSSYWDSQYWKLSTSNTSPGDYSWGGFAAVVPEGYGINYAIGKERVRMSISSWNNYEGTSSEAFRKIITTTLEDFGEVAEREIMTE
ncbi:acyltransferase ChoActase/COT/CPT [Mycotypha africana]|uniref:acyltransferase ChoActase/COT/CPT n=1 Tax=Mycotypha africana TaxID=64632 RepID=UPI00230130DF|nr:acyltransferase ChoActase/COT/CPT [Mycotypha africana]KAI8968023.1 acyltransferase ChoActase/COT/CPT [Mycotypha africana]